MERKRMIILIALLLCGCVNQEGSSSEFTSTEQTVQSAYAPDALLPAGSTVLKPEPSGEKEERCADAVIDYSHTEEGYVMVRYTGQTDQRLKVLVKGPRTTYSYNLYPDDWTVFPMSDGDGNYQVGIYRNITDTKYTEVLVARFDVMLKNEFAPFLRPNQFVKYSEDTDAVAKAAELCAGLTNPLEKVEAVYDFVVSTLRYDEERAKSVESGYIPSLDEVLREEKGICFDYAALMAAMLRSQQIPCKLVIGYAEDTYHAWVSVWTEERGWIDGNIYFEGYAWKRMDPTFASFHSRSEEIMDFIEHGNYTEEYLY